MAFKSLAVPILATNTDVVICPVTTEGAVVLGVSNLTASASTFTIKFYRNSTGLTQDIATDEPIAAKTTLKFPIPISMEQLDKLIMVAPAPNILAATGTFTYSAATPIATGFNPRGVYSTSATYQKNDLVTFTDSASKTNSYIGIAISLNQNPETATAFWMLLSKQGINSAGDMSASTWDVNADGFIDIAKGGTGAGTATVARTNLGLGNAATKDIGTAAGTVAAGDDNRFKAVGTAAGTVAAGDDSRIVGAAQKTGNNAMTGTNTYDKTQTHVQGTLTTSVAADLSTKQRWLAIVNGSAFVIANPTNPVDGTIYDFAINFTTAHGCGFGSKFKLGDYTASASAGQKDRISFEYNAADDLYYLRGYNKNVSS